MLPPVKLFYFLWNNLTGPRRGGIVGSAPHSLSPPSPTTDNTLTAYYRLSRPIIFNHWCHYHIKMRPRGTAARLLRVVLSHPEDKLCSNGSWFSFCSQISAQTGHKENDLWRLPKYSNAKFCFKRTKKKEVILNWCSSKIYEACSLIVLF